MPGRSIVAIFWKPWASEKTAEGDLKVVNFRGLTPSRRFVFAGCACGWVLKETVNEQIAKVTQKRPPKSTRNQTKQEIFKT